MTLDAFPRLPVLIIDDEEQILMSYDTALRMSGINNIVSCSDSRRLKELLEQNDGQVLLLDLMMPHVSGEELLPMVAREYPHIPVVVITGKDDTQTAVRCMKEGAFDFMVKPVDRERLVTTVKQAISISELNRQNRALREQLLTGQLRNAIAFADIVTNHPAMYAIFQYIEAIANSSQPILITGETGSGKELLARAIHKCGLRSGPFHTINVAGLSDDEFTNTFIGRETSPTDVVKHESLVMRTAGGTLFIDEVGELTPSSQIKLLRFLLERESLLSSIASLRSSASLVVATNQDLHALCKEGKFRKDLYYRLCAHQIQLPALRDRIDDIPLLLDHFLELAAGEMGKKKPTPLKELVGLLCSYHYPGNVRELRTMVFDAMSYYQAGTLPLEIFKKRMFEDGEKTEEGAEVAGEEAPVHFGPRLPSMEELKQKLIEEALKRTGGNKSHAAAMLGISRQAIIIREKTAREGKKKKTRKKKEEA